MPRTVHVFRQPERFVAGAIGGPGKRAFYLQAADEAKVISVLLQKVQVAVLAERLSVLIEEVARRLGTDAGEPKVDTEPLCTPVEQEFRGGTIGLGWDVTSRNIVVELLHETEYEVDESIVLDDTEEGPDAVRVFLSLEQAKAFALRAEWEVTEPGAGDAPSTEVQGGSSSATPAQQPAAAERVNLRRIFISYRRDDSSHVAGRIADWLINRLGEPRVFMDVNSIELGLDFREVIAGAVGQCDVLLAIVGRYWLTCTDDAGNRRLDATDDLVRLEIEAALERNIRVIPVLVEGARVPARQDLPISLEPLTRRNALTIRHESFRDDIMRLVRVIERVLETPTDR